MIRKSGDFLKIKNGVLSFKKKEVKVNAFSYNEEITNLCFGKRLKIINKTAFNGCRNLKRVTFNDDIKEIKYGAFLNCSSLTEVVLPSHLESLGEAVFKDNSNLKKIILPPLKVLPENLLRNCFKLEEIIIPDTVEVIEEGCFHSCVALKKVVFGKNVREIGAYAFKRCLSLERVEFPDTLKIIGDKAFEGAKELKFVKFNSELQHIGKAVFHNKVFENLKIDGSAYTSSFIPRDDIEICPTVNIPNGVKKLVLGFEGILPVAYRDSNKNCTNHIISLENEKAKLFIPDTYYSYRNEEDCIINDGKFDFFKYDNQFEKADSVQKAFVSVFRLAYPVCLEEYQEKVYYDSIKGSEKDLAFFSVEVNDEKVLSFLLKISDFDTDFTTSLYSYAVKKGFMNLQTIISTEKKKTALFEAEKLLEEILI